MSIETKLMEIQKKATANKLRTGRPIYKGVNAVSDIVTENISRMHTRFGFRPVTSRAISPAMNVEIAKYDDVTERLVAEQQNAPKAATKPADGKFDMSAFDAEFQAYMDALKEEMKDTATLSVNGTVLTEGVAGLEPEA